MNVEKNSRRNRFEYKMFVSHSSNWSLEDCEFFHIEIVDGNWGKINIAEVHHLLKNVAQQFLKYFDAPPSAKIYVECHPHRSGAEVQCRNSLTGEHIVLLSHQDFYSWSYEFAHELCHVLSSYDNLHLLPNKWFHESLCELASIFILKQMPLNPLESPSFPNWQDFSTALKKYADELIARPEFQLQNNLTLPDWFKANEQSLRADPYQRGKNGVVALQLLPLVENNPKHWQSILFIPDSAGSFENFLQEWRTRCPEPQKLFVTDIIELFGFNPK
jgi:hypothetical protein